MVAAEAGEGEPEVRVGVGVQGLEREGAREFCHARIDVVGELRRLGDGIDQAAAFHRQFFGYRDPGEPGHFHDELVGALDADRVVQRHRLLAVSGDERQRLFGAVFLHRDRRLGVDRVGRIFQRGAAVVHAELAVGGRVPHRRRVADDVHLDAEQAEDALELTDDQSGSALVLAFEIPVEVLGDFDEVSAVVQVPLVWTMMEAIFLVGEDADDLTWFAPQEAENLIDEWMKR